MLSDLMNAVTGYRKPTGKHQRVKFKNGRALYIAYGSNLNTRHMASRCPAAQRVGSSALHGFQLVFRGVADIEWTGQADHIAGVGVWSITPRCLRALDRYEGCPSLYRREIVTCYIDGEHIEGVTYMMNQVGYKSPFADYVRTIERGFDDFALNRDLLNDAIERSGGALATNSGKYTH